MRSSCAAEWPPGSGRECSAAVQEGSSGSFCPQHQPRYTEPAPRTLPPAATNTASLLVHLVDLADAAGYDVTELLLEPLALAALDPDRYNNERVTALEETARKYDEVRALILPLTKRERRIRRVLGVPLRATHKEVRKAYLKLCRALHPDSSGDLSTTGAFDAASQAMEEYEKLPAAYNTLVTTLMRTVK